MFGAVDRLTPLLLVGPLLVSASPLFGFKTSIHKADPSVTAVSQTDVDSYTPYANYAAAVYKGPATNFASWKCGVYCDANPNFEVTAAGGDGKDIQWWFVGYDPDLDTVIVAHEGTQPKDVYVMFHSSHLAPVVALKDTSIQIRDVSDVFAVRESPDPAIFPGIDKSISLHEGFVDSQEKSASLVLAAVETTLKTYKAPSVTYVGHSLGAAIAVIDAVYGQIHLTNPPPIKAVVFGLPRLGNAAWANWVDAHISLVHINNKQDIIPVLPATRLGYVHPQGEIHIHSDGTWYSCPGHDNLDSRCSTSTVSLLDFKLSDHSGPYNGIMI